MKNFFSLVLLAATIAAEPLEDIKAKLEEIEFVNYMTKFGKEYLDIRVMKEHMEIWRENKLHVEKLNSNPESLATFALNATSDMTPEELNQILGVKITSEESNRRILSASTDFEGDDASHGRQLRTYTYGGYKNDWRDGIDYKVSNQGGCNSSWAFAANTVQELMQYHKSAIDGDQIQYFSVQQILDCNPRGYGCNMVKGAVDIAWFYSKEFDTHLEKDYGDGEYLEKKQDKCETDSIKETASKVKNYGLIKSDPKDPTDIVKKMTEHLAQKGPLTVYINDADFSFQFYHGGIVTSPVKSWSTVETNFAMALVGQDVDEQTGTEYWILQNSWGASWGENGSIRVKKTEGDGIFGMNKQVYWLELAKDYGYGYKSFKSDEDY